MFDLFGRKKYALMREELETLRVAVQNFEFDPATGTYDTENARYRGNKYPGDLNMVYAVNRAYIGEADWGVNLVKSIVEIRAAMVGGAAGVEVGQSLNYKGEAKRELDFIREFMAYNEINQSTQMDWAVEGGIDGRCMFELSTAVVDKKNKVRARYVPFYGGITAPRYTIKTDEYDYTRHLYADIGSLESGQVRRVSPDRYVYRKFGGRKSCVNSSSPLVGHVLPQIEAIDQALRDWREINVLYASPTPTVSVDNAEDAQTQYTMMTQTLKWQIGRLLVIGGGDYKLVGPESGGIDSLMDEITTNLKIVSGTTGIPPHFLGFPDLMSNRATADGLLEMMFAATAKERTAWIEAYTELFRKAIILYNKVSGDNLNPEAVVAVLPENTQTRLRQLVDVWLPLFESKAISRPTFLTRVPGVDPDKEEETVKKALKDGSFDGVEPQSKTNGQLGRNKPGTNHDPDNTAQKTRLEKRTTGAGRNAR